LLTLCFLENRELFALSHREFLTVGRSWPFFHIAKIHGKWKSQDAPKMGSRESSRWVSLLFKTLNWVLGLPGYNDTVLAHER
jgi:hypothetical protein